MISAALQDEDVEVARKKVSKTIKNVLLTDDHGPSHFRAEIVLPSQRPWPLTKSRVLGTELRNNCQLASGRKAYVDSVHLISDRAAIQSGAFGLASYEAHKQQRSQSMGIER